MSHGCCKVGAQRVCDLIRELLIGAALEDYGTALSGLTGAYPESTRRKGGLRLSRKRKFIGAFAIGGLVIALAIFAYFHIAYTYSLGPPNATFNVSCWVLCPPSLLTIAFIDIRPSVPQQVEMISIVTLLNGALYAWLGACAYRVSLWKSN
jgi:hypothetical protein